MKLAKLFWRLLRYRVAVMLLLFLLIGAAQHDTLTAHVPELVLAGLALGFGYISATSVNDLADREIDVINHRHSSGRPLITGGAAPQDLWIVFGLASAAAIVLGLLSSPGGAVIMAAAVLINALYSLPPVRLSYHTFLAPLVLGLAYVGIPYALGVSAVQGSLVPADLGWLAGLYGMFVGRMLLKDFRDRQGDAAYGKPTFLLRYGKTATCLASATLIGLGGALLLWQTRGEWWLALLIAGYLLSILVMLRQLQLAPEGSAEQLRIGVGAKMGNGLLLTLLTVLTLDRTAATTTTQVLAASLLTVSFFINYVTFLRHPDMARLAYKG